MATDGLKPLPSVVWLVTCGAGNTDNRLRSSRVSSAGRGDGNRLRPRRRFFVLVRSCCLTSRDRNAKYVMMPSLESRFEDEVRGTIISRRNQSPNQGPGTRTATSRRSAAEIRVAFSSGAVVGGRREKGGCETGMPFWSH